MNRELNFYYCDHNDVIAERIGDILEDMGIFSFTPLARYDMNLYAKTGIKIRDIRNWNNKNVRKGGRVNLVIFLTKYVKGSELLEEELEYLRRTCDREGFNIYTIVDDEMRLYIDHKKDIYSWLYRSSTIFDVYNSCIIADTIDVARAMVLDLVRQRFMAVRKKELPDKAFDRNLLELNEKNVYISSIASAYDEIPEQDFSGRFLLIFSVFKYVEHNMGKSPYGKCMEYLLRRSVKELLMTKKDLELSTACLMYEMFNMISS